MNRALLEVWDLPAGATLAPLGGGLINHTLGVHVDGHLHLVIQRLNTAIFAPEVHLDIDAVTRHLEARGVTTPRLVPTRAGALWHVDDEGGCWRALTPIGARTHDRLQDPRLAREAGAAVARFHAATDDLDHDFVFTRPGAHDTAAHMAGLAAALEAHPTHRLRERVAPLADELFERWGRVDAPPPPPPRIIHGDLKIANLRFDDDDHAVGLVDLDTLARGGLDVELGDALRSWCNPSGEDHADVQLRTDLFAAALAGYRRERPLDELERACVVPGLLRICLELAARFLRDALEERYFGFDPARGRGEHNLLRGSGQLALARSVARQRAVLEALTAT